MLHRLFAYVVQTELCLVRIRGEIVTEFTVIGRVQLKALLPIRYNLYLQASIFGITQCLLGNHNLVSIGIGAALPRANLFCH